MHVRITGHKTVGIGTDNKPASSPFWKNSRINRAPALSTAATTSIFLDSLRTLVDTDSYSDRSSLSMSADVAVLLANLKMNNVVRFFHQTSRRCPDVQIDVHLSTDCPTTARCSIFVVILFIVISNFKVAPFKSFAIFWDIAAWRMVEFSSN